MRATRDEIEAAGRSFDAICADRARAGAGVVWPDVVRPCTLGDGVSPLDAGDEARGREVASRTVAFVPASGAATRFFEPLYRVMTSGAPAPESLVKLPFWDGAASVAEVLARWGDVPKGLIPVHAPRRTLVDEHLDEAAELGLAGVHITVAADHLPAFQRAVGDRAAVSVQDPATDTLAFDEGLEPLRDASGALVFRPSGHGALLANLAAAARDLVLIKNVDNIATAEARRAILPYRWRLLGRLARVVDQVSAVWSGGSEADAQRLLGEAFGIDVPLGAARERLDRPVRVCGMVPDRGEPGGGPYWCRGSDGVVAPQILEGAQLDPTQPWRARATHFNPVEIAASARGPGGPRPLHGYVAHEQAMVVQRSIAGRRYVAVERPGLWNGAMAGWNSLFVELPEEVFQPVKTVDDLFRPAHCGG